MTIQPVSGKANTPTFTTKPVSTGKVKGSDTQLTGQLKDNVEITAVAKEITQALKSSENTPIIDKKRVEEVKQALSEGTYPIDAEKIASKMIQIEQEQFNNSR